MRAREPDQTGFIELRATGIDYLPVETDGARIAAAGIAELLN